MGSPPGGLGLIGLMDGVFIGSEKNYISHFSSLMFGTIPIDQDDGFTFFIVNRIW